MELISLYLLMFIPLAFLISLTDQFLTSQKFVLMQLREQLEYPLPLQIWDDYSKDLCNVPSTPQMTIVCLDNAVIELKIMGDKLSNISHFEGIPLPDHTLSQNFSIDSFTTTLSKLNNLRVLSLVSLGIWGPLPDKIHRLFSLEILDLSSNFMFGSIPPKIFSMAKLQTLAMDANFFNHTIPDLFESLLNLTSLSLKRNQFRGGFPNSICRVKTITDVALSHNDLSGKLPDMSDLSGLHVLDLRSNHFISELPYLPKSVVTVLLGENSFSGEIPEQFGELGHLRHLDLSYNFLSGTPPSVLFSLTNLTYLNLASNRLTDFLSTNLRCVDGLGFVDISSNKIEGTLPSCLGTTSGERVVRFSGNCLNDTSQHQRPQNDCLKDQLKEKQQYRGKYFVGVIGGAIGGSIILILLVIGLRVVIRQYRLFGRLKQHRMWNISHYNSPTGLSSELVANARMVSHVAKLGPEDGMLYRLFSLEELKEATNNFNQSNFIGKGSLGVLYKGRLESGADVAVRSIAWFKKNSIQNLKCQLDFLSKLRHPHLVGLLGHCIDDSAQDDCCATNVLLIYEFVSGRNYRATLSERVCKWSERLGILIGVAKAVHFLHSGISPGCFDNRLRINNILVDDEGIPKLSDYGLSIIAEEDEKFEAKTEGTKSCCRKIEKSGDDVYSFGFILLESLVGPIIGGRADAFLLGETKWFGSQDSRKKVVDPVVLTSCSQESLSIVVSITNKCVSSESSIRPSFEDVLWNLQYAAQVQAAADAELEDSSESLDLF